MFQLADVDRVADQDAKLFQRVQGFAGTVGVGLHDALDDVFACQAGDAAVAVLSAKHFQPPKIADLAGIAQPDVLGTFHVGRDQRRDGAWRRSTETIADRFDDLAKAAPPYRLP